ncbi:MAG TPA: NAD-dependent epimerase/dehydratase family protein [Polyangia bacterium]
MSGRVALVTGIAGGIARQVGAELVRRGYTVVGVDYRRLGRPLDYPAEVYQANYNKTKVEDIFRRHRPSLVLHLGRVGNLKERMGKRFDLNVVGSRKVMDLGLKYGTTRLVVLSTFHIYGAHAANHIPISEEDPVRAGVAFPQIADAIQADSQALLWTYQHPEMQTVLLRPTNIIGPHVQNTMSGILRRRVIPYVLGFDPMTQFIHADDLTTAVLRAAEGAQVGVYNVAGPDAIPWRAALAVAGAHQVPVPSFVAFAALAISGRFSPTIPPYLVNFFKSPCVITDAAFRAAFDWAPRIGAVAAVRSTAAAAEA